MIYLVLIPLLLTVMPWITVRYIFTTDTSRKFSYEQAMPYLFAAAALWIIAFFLPNIPISAETDTFSQHATGGVVAGILFAFARRAYDWKFNIWWQPWLALYGFVSALGVANELFELLTTKMGIIFIDSSDVWWDLLANTAGGFIAYGIISLVRKLK